MTLPGGKQDELQAVLPERLDGGAITLDSCQQEALDVMLSGRNVFLTGEAGSGKSTVLQRFRAIAGSGCVYVAPTGVAAVNIGGTTIHSLFQLKPVLLTPKDIGFVRGRRRALLKKIRTVIVDEVSMMRSDLFCALDHRLREVADAQDAALPFGGRQMILVGDFHQLAPVVSNHAEARWLNENLGGVYAFQTPLWQQAGFRCVALNIPHRQQNDAAFLSLLRSVRCGELFAPLADAGGRNPVEMLADRVASRVQDDMPRIALCTTNREADTINKKMCGELPGKAVTFRAATEGTFNERDYPTDVVLSLKPGARVMILCNKHLPDGGFLYVNGDTGIFRGCIGSGANASARVELDHNGEVVEVQSFRWSNYEYTFKYDTRTRSNLIDRQETGAFVQMPLRLAYAVTIHKAQGMTLPGVELKLSGGCFAHGQLYTALSRCRTLEGLRIDREVLGEDLLQDSAVTGFYRAIEAGKMTGDAPAPEPQAAPEPERDEKGRVPMMVPTELLPAMERYLQKLLRRNRKNDEDENYG